MDDFIRRSLGATSRAELASALEESLRAALRPRALAVWLRRADGGFEAAGREGDSLPPLDLDRHADVIERLTAGPCWDADARAAAAVLPTNACEPGGVSGLVAVADRRGHVVGLVAIGTPPDTREWDAALRMRLGDVVAQAGVAFEVIRLAEQLAERMDAGRRADREIAIARDVQARLLPQRPPELANLELSARCRQARLVGGDYYDFLALAPGQVGLVLADISGKGVHAALRMANLQAHLRSQAGSTPQDPLRVLRAVNRMLCESARPGQFATLFLGIWSDTARRMSYINCGHNPPLVLRRDGTVEWLAATTTVLGAFEEWDCALARASFAPGDVLVAYSDGITEAEGDDGPFGEDRLLSVVRRTVSDAATVTADALLGAVEEFASGRAVDDLTVWVAKVR